MDTKKNQQVATYLTKHIDYTTLSGSETEDDIERFLTTAITKINNTQIACVCLDKKFVAFAKKFLKTNKSENIKVACVVNFPNGSSDLASIKDEIHFAIESGVDEIDYVLDYKQLLNNEEVYVEAQLQSVRELCADKVLKVIIESGVLHNAGYISLASRISINSKADFIKTSTGKAKTGATLYAASIILDTILETGKHNLHFKKHDDSFDKNTYERFVGIKVSGGINDIETAWKYYSLTANKFKNKNLDPAQFRIGTSKLFSSIIEMNAK